MRIWQLVLMGLGTAIVALDTAVNIAFPAISLAFAAPLPAIQWLVVAYVLTYASFMLAVGHLGDLFGYRLVFRLGLAWSAAALVLCALAPSYPILIAARVAQGMGAAFVLGCGPAVLTSLYPEERRAHALALYTMMFALAAALGPILGGALIGVWGWPAVFWFRAPLALAAALLLPALPRPAPGFARLRSFDLAGAALLGVAVASLLLSLDRLRHLADGDFSILLVGGVAAAAWISFVRHERRAPDPIIDLRVFRSFSFSCANIGSVLVNLAGFSVLLLLPYYLARSAAFSIAAAGGVLALSGAGTVAAAPMAAAVVRRFGAPAIATSGAALSTLGLALIAGPGSPPDLPWLAAGLVLQGLGAGMFQVAYMDLVTGSIAPSARGVAGSLAMLTRTLGVAAGATVLTLVFTAAEALMGAGALGTSEPFLAVLSLTFWFAAAVSAIAGAIVFASSRARAR